MKVGDLVVSKAYEKYADVVPAKLVMQVTAKVGAGLPERSGPYVVLSDNPETWQPAGSFFVVSPA